jgi:hypothetical protein
MTQAQTQPVSIEQWVSSVTNFSSQYDSLRYIYLGATNGAETAYTSSPREFTLCFQ